MKGEGMNVYLDTSALNRIFDDQSQPRIFLEASGIKGLDALHLACAERLKADYFVTCDGRIIRKYTGTVIVVNPVELTMTMLKQEADNADS